MIWDARTIAVNGPGQLAALFAAVGVHPEGAAIMLPRGRSKVILVKGLKTPAAAAVKQAMLSAGGDCAVNAAVITCAVERSDAVLLGSVDQLRRAADSLSRQPWGLPRLAAWLRQTLADHEPLSFAGMTLERPRLMGILNVTPDSFSDGGRYLETEAAVARAFEMAEQGAHIIDIGGESSRPGSQPVSADEEIERIAPVLEKIAPALTVSVDTRRAAVARFALEAGAKIVNDISAGRDDPEIAAVAAQYEAGLVLMHMRGAPADMQDAPCYEDVVGEVRSFLVERAQWAHAAGVNSTAIDPGIGFGKTVEHNLSLLRGVPALLDTGYTVVVGHSRKSFIGKLLDLEVERRTAPSLAVALRVAALGAHIIRTHDVAETAQALRIWREIDEAQL